MQMRLSNLPHTSIPPVFSDFPAGFFYAIIEATCRMFSDPKRMSGRGVSSSSAQYENLRVEYGCDYKLALVNERPLVAFLWYNRSALLWDASFLTGGQRTGSPVNRGTEPTTVVPKGTYWGRELFGVLFFC